MITIFPPPPAQIQLLKTRRVEPIQPPDRVDASPLRDPADIAPMLKLHQDQVKLSSESLLLLQQYERSQHQNGSTYFDPTQNR